MKVRNDTHKTIFKRSPEKKSGSVFIHTQPQQGSLVVLKKDKNRVKKMPPADVSPELLRIKGTWPYDLNPDELIIEEKRIIIKRNYFPAGGSVITVPVHNLSSFELNHALLFSAVYIKEKGKEDAIVVQWLKQKAASRAKAIIDGLLLKESESIEIYTTDRRQFVNTLQSIGNV